MDFATAHAFVSKWEGGLVDHPTDPGGITNWGISIAFLRNYQKSLENSIFLTDLGLLMPVDVETIRQLTKEQSEKIFKRAFWDVMKPETFPPLTVVALYDISVNGGYGRGIKLLQQACNTFDGPKIGVDGLVGPATRGRAWEIGVTQGKDLELALASLEKRRAFYRSLSTFPTFGKGWLRRTDDMEKLLKELAKA